MLDKTVEAHLLQLAQKEVKRIDELEVDNIDSMDLDLEDADDSEDSEDAGGQGEPVAKRARTSLSSTPTSMFSSSSSSSAAPVSLVEPPIFILHKHGQEKQMFGRVFEELGGNYSQLFETVCFGKIVWYLSGRNMNGSMKDGRPSLIPMDMSSLVYALQSRRIPSSCRYRYASSNSCF